MCDTRSGPFRGGLQLSAERGLTFRLQETAAVAAAAAGGGGEGEGGGGGGEEEGRRGLAICMSEQTMEVSNEAHKVKSAPTPRSGGRGIGSGTGGMMIGKALGPWLVAVSDVARSAHGGDTLHTPSPDRTNETRSRSPRSVAVRHASLVPSCSWATSSTAFKTRMYVHTYGTYMVGGLNAV
ncbi:hypothetical protein L209DRAFT_724150 [Thermothelomyces heterothallicus CBS 203.75]